MEAAEASRCAVINGLPQVAAFSEFHQLLASHNILAPGPRFLQLEMDISNKCNLRCRMCYYSFDRYFSRQSVHLTPADFSRIAETLLDHAHTLTLSLGSEPLISPHFVRILEIAAPYRVPEVTFYTNGLLFTNEAIDAIVSCGVTQVCISIDGATPQTYEHIRRGASFRRLIENIERLVARRATAGTSTPVLRFDVVLMKSNIHELEDIVILACRLGVARLNFFHMVVYDGLGIEDESLVGQKALSNYWLNRALEKARELGLSVVAHPEPFCLNPPEAAMHPSVPPAFQNTPYCLYPFFHISMNSEGDVLPCPFAHGEAPFGRLSSDGPFERIWFGEKFTTLRTRILEHDPPPMCRRCSYLASKNPDLAELFAPRAP